jgi:hypothetical protein
MTFGAQLGVYVCFTLHKHTHTSLYAHTHTHTHTVPWVVMGHIFATEGIHVAINTAYSERPRHAK